MLISDVLMSVFVHARFVIQLFFFKTQRPDACLSRKHVFSADTAAEAAEWVRTDAQKETKKKLACLCHTASEALVSGGVGERFLFI